MTEERLVSLIARQLAGRLDLEEARELRAWTEKDPGNKALLDRISDEGELTKELERYQAFDPAAGYSGWLLANGRRRRLKIIRITGWAAAASLLATVMVGGLMRHSHSNSDPVPAVARNVQPVLPGHNTAMLTLSSGREILLDSAASGGLAIDGGARLTKVDSGSLTYRELSNGQPAPVVYNTLTTPKSGQYQLTLADGSRVWLNNVSSLRFPTAFQGKDRVVELSGEGYFEVANDPARPFIVKVGGESVEVLGTSFNVMAYPEEGGTQTTLLTGAVRVRSRNNVVRLKPDEQARMGNNGMLTVAEGVNAEDIVSWKNGFFYFGRANFAAVMRQLGRWYNIDIVYQGKVPDLEFGGKIDRELNLQELLKYLDRNQVHFRLEGRKLIVL